VKSAPVEMKKSHPSREISWVAFLCSIVKANDTLMMNIYYP